MSEADEKSKSTSTASDEAFLKECEEWVRDAKPTIQPEKWWDKIERLISMVREREQVNFDTEKRCYELSGVAAKLQLANRVLDEALEFYANPVNYLNDSTTVIASKEIRMKYAGYERGEKARLAREKAKELVK